MGYRAFHQRLSEQASKVVFVDDWSTLVVLDDKAFVGVEPLDGLEQVQVIRAFYVDGNHRGQGVGTKLMKTIVDIAEQEQVILGAHVSPFELLRSPGHIELSAMDFLKNQMLPVTDFDGSQARHMRNLLRSLGFDFGYDEINRFSGKWSQYYQVMLGLFDKTHMYVPKSLDERTRSEFIESHKIGRELPVLKLASKMCEKFDHLGNADYKLRDRDGYLRIVPLGDNATFANSFMRIAFASGNDAELAVREVQALAELTECALIGITSPTRPEARYKYRQADYEQTLRENGFDLFCPNEFLGDGCTGTAFQLLWMPGSFDVSLRKAAHLLSATPLAS